MDCIGGSFRRRTFGDALCNRRLRLGAERREHLASQAYAAEEAGDPRANLSEVLGDAAPMDVVGPRPEVERTGCVPPRDRVAGGACSVQRDASLADCGCPVENKKRTTDSGSLTLQRLDGSRRRSPLRLATQEPRDGFPIARLGPLLAVLPQTERPAPHSHQRRGFLDR